MQNTTIIAGNTRAIPFARYTALDVKEAYTALTLMALRDFDRTSILTLAGAIKVEKNVTWH